MSEDSVRVRMTQCIYGELEAKRRSKICSLKMCMSQCVAMDCLHKSMSYGRHRQPRDAKLRGCGKLKFPQNLWYYLQWKKAISRAGYEKWTREKMVFRHCLQNISFRMNAFFSCIEYVFERGIFICSTKLKPGSIDGIFFSRNDSSTGRKISRLKLFVR